MRPLAVQMRDDRSAFVQRLLQPVYDLIRLWCLAPTRQRKKLPDQVQIDAFSFMYRYILRESC